MTAAIPGKTTQVLFRIFNGRGYPQFLVRRARQELQGFVRLLEGLGVIVRRPEAMDFDPGLEVARLRQPVVHYAPFGGAFHCATLDIRRRGGLGSYF